MGLRWFKALGLRLRVFGFGISGLGLEILDFETLHLLKHFSRNGLYRIQGSQEGS